MRAARVAELGGAPAPADVAPPEAADRVLLDVRAVALNPLDLAVAAGRRDPARLERTRALGADATVTVDGDLAAPFGGEGPTVVLDALWGAPVAAAVDVAAPRARIVHFGQSAGPEATLGSAAVRGKELEILGQSNFARTKEEL